MRVHRRTTRGLREQHYQKALTAELLKAGKAGLANTCGGPASSEPKTDCRPGDADRPGGPPTPGGANANHPLNPAKRLNPLEIA